MPIGVSNGSVSNITSQHQPTTGLRAQLTFLATLSILRQSGLNLSSGRNNQSPSPYTQNKTKPVDNATHKPPLSKNILNKKDINPPPVSYTSPLPQSGFNRYASPSKQRLSAEQQAVLSDILAHKGKLSGANVTGALLKGLDNDDAAAKQQRLKLFLEPKSLDVFDQALKDNGVKAREIKSIHKILFTALERSSRRSNNKNSDGAGQNPSPYAKAGALTDQGIFPNTRDKLAVTYGVLAASHLSGQSLDASGNTISGYIPREQRVQDAKIFYNMAKDIEQARLAINLQQAAHSHAKTLLIQLGMPELDPDKVYLNKFNSAISDSLAYTGWVHSGNPTSTRSLTEVVIRNFLPGEVEYGSISGMDQYSGLYKVGSNSTTGYGAQNEVQLLPSDFMNKLEQNDFSSAYKTLHDQFWAKHGKDYRIIAKSVFINEAENAYKKGELTEEGYHLVMRVAVPGFSHQPSYLGTLRPAISLDILQAVSPTGSAVRQLDIYGYSSTIPIFSDPNQRDELGKQVIYSPVTQRFHEFNNKKEFCRWIEEQAKDPAKRKVFLKHWTFYDQEDGTTYAGVKTALEGIGGMGDISWRPEKAPFKYILMDNTPINGDLFTYMAKRVQTDQTLNAQTLINSNANVQEAIILRSIQAAEEMLLPLAMLSPEIFAIPAAINAGVQTGLGIHESIDSKTTDTRKQGMETTLTGLINGLFSVFSEIPVSEEIPELRAVNFANIDLAQVGGEYMIAAPNLNVASQIIDNIDLTEAILNEGSTTSTANAGSIWRLPNNDEYFVKSSVAHLMKWQDVNGNLEMIYNGPLTNEEQRYFAAKEVVATRQTALQALHENAAPEAFLGERKIKNANNEFQTEYYVATKVVKNFQELGDILVDLDFIEEQLQTGNKPQIIQEEIRGKTTQLRQLQEKFKDFKNSNPEWYLSRDVKLKNDISLMRELRKQVVDELLSKELREQLLVHVMNDQVIGELDTINTWGQNVGFMKTSSGEWQLVALDRGASYDTGFWGTAKGEDGYSTAKGQRPFILQSDKEQIFTPETAIYSDNLPPHLGNDLSNFPYPEDIEPISGAGANEGDRIETLKKLAYQDLILEGDSGSGSAFDKNSDLLCNPPTKRLEDRGLMGKHEVIATDQRRRAMRIEQAGGEDEVRRWARQNPFEADRIKHLANAKRARMGLPEYHD